jgi:hypothetical protein
VNRLRDTVTPDMRGSNSKECGVLTICRSSGFQLSYPFNLRLSPMALAWDGKHCAGTALSGATCAADTARASLQTRRRIRFSPVPLLWRETPSGKRSTQPPASHKPRVHPNDIVVFANQPGTWEVIAPVNGSKADIRRSEGFDTRIVTAHVESLIVVRRAGSPGYSY